MRLRVPPKENQRPVRPARNPVVRPRLAREESKSPSASAEQGRAAGDAGRTGFSLDGVSIYPSSAPVQRKPRREQESVVATAQIHEAAQRGTSGAGQSLPHLERIQQSFGRHDLRELVAHTDAAAASGADAISAVAFAVGKHVAFAAPPDLHTAAHEAAHFVQQRSGLHLPGRVGQPEDVHERHADAVAARVVAGESSEALLDAYASAPGASRGQTEPCVQAKSTADQGSASSAGADEESMSVAIIGAGRLLDSFASDFKRAYPKSTVFDRSAATVKDIQGEISLGKSRAASPEFHRLARQAGRNLAASPDADTTVLFERTGEVESITVRGPGGERRLTFRFDQGTSFKDIDEFIGQIIAIVAQLSKRGRRRQRGSGSDRELVA